MSEEPKEEKEIPPEEVPEELPPELVRPEEIPDVIPDEMFEGISEEKPEEKKEEKPEEKKEEKNNNQNDPEIKKYTQEDFDKNSFCSKAIYEKSKQYQAPFPIRLTKDQLTIKYNPDYLKDFSIKDYYGVYCLNQEIVDRQGGVIKHLIMQ